jgi:hypothetical protein
MRYMLFLVVALAASLAWQSSVFASLSVDRSCAAAQEDDKDKKQSGTDQEPDCD